MSMDGNINNSDYDEDTLEKESHDLQDSLEDIEKKKEAEKLEKKKERRSFIITLLIAFVAALAMRMFVFEFVGIDGPSMEPTLIRNETVFINKIVYRYSTPSRGDVVVCQFPGIEDHYVKRVMGLPGETLQIKDGVVYINGEALSKDYYNQDEVPRGNFGPVVIEDDSVFLMGDNRNHSQDSRALGTLKISDITGKVEFIVWPLDKLRNF